MAKVQDNNIFITKGDKAEFTFSVDGFDLTGKTVKFGVKENYNNAECKIVKTVEDGKFTILPEDTETLTPGVYFYDVKVVDGDSVVCTAIAGAQFVIGQSVFVN